MLSGFLIGGILLDSRGSSHYFKSFYTRRIYRILPVYYVWLAIYFLLGLVLSSSDSSALIGASLRPLLYLLFVQNILSAPTSPFAHYMVSPTWSLAVEEQFYLLAPIIVRTLTVRRLARLLIACVVVVPIIRYFVFSSFPNGAERSIILMPCRADALAWGILAAIIWRSSAKNWLQRRVFMLKLLATILLVGAIAMIKWLPSPHTPLQAAWQYSWIALLFWSVLLLVLLDQNCIAARITRWQFLRRWGTISYCFYLIHLGVLGGLHWLVFREIPHINTLGGCAVTVLAALVSHQMAKMSWKYFEKPLIERGHLATGAAGMYAVGKVQQN